MRKVRNLLKEAIKYKNEFIESNKLPGTRCRDGDVCRSVLVNMQHLCEESSSKSGLRYAEFPLTSGESQEFFSKRSPVF